MTVSSPQASSIKSPSAPKPESPSQQKSQQEPQQEPHTPPPKSLPLPTSSPLQQKLRTLPPKPGVYLHKNSSGDIIYVGKAAILKTRVRHYFQNSQKDPKTAALVAEIADTDWLITDSEMDALFLESELIKRYQPKWNILLRDDKTVTYIRIDLKSQVPYLSFTRTPQDDAATYIGPFYGQLAIKKALRILRKTFPYYDKPYTGKKSLYTDLGLTPGIEIGKSTPAAYKRTLRHLITYLQKGRKTLTTQLEKSMHQAAAAQDFETAATLRNQLRSLKELQRKIVFSNQEFLDLSKDQALTELQSLLHLPNPPRRIEGYDISHHSGSQAVASMVVFTNGVADRTAYRKFKIKHSKNNDFANLQEVLTRRLKHSEWPLPDLILIDGGIPQLSALQPLLDPTGIPYLGLAERFETVVLPLKSSSHPSPATTSSSSSHFSIPQNSPIPAPSSAPQSSLHLPPPQNPLIPAPPSTPTTFQELPLSQNSHLIKLLQRIRDEAHRFAITYHTLLKRKNLLK